MGMKLYEIKYLSKNLDPEFFVKNVIKISLSLFNHPTSAQKHQRLKLITASFSVLNHGGLFKFPKKRYRNPNLKPANLKPK